MKTTQQGAQLTRRALLLAGAAAPLCACTNRISFSYPNLDGVFAITSELTKSSAITRAQASRIPFSSLGFRLGGSTERMFVLTSSSGRDFLWTSSDRWALATRQGRIVQSGGFNWNLSGTRFLGRDPPSEGLLAALPQVPVRRLCDFPDIENYAVPIDARFERRTNETISILGTKINTAVIVENCASARMDWTFENTFWADVQTGFVWRSRQNIHPKLDPITLEVLRPPK